MDVRADSKTRSLVDPLLLALAVASLATAGIHFAVIPEHFEEYVPYGVFFSIVAWLQGLWALGVLIRPTRSILLAAIVGNIALIAMWGVSRSTGLPMGPEPWTPESLGGVDVLCAALEAGIVVGCLQRLRREKAMNGTEARSVAAVGAFAVVMIVLTTAAFELSM